MVGWEAGRRKRLFGRDGQAVAPGPIVVYDQGASIGDC